MSRKQAKRAAFYAGRRGARAIARHWKSIDWAKCLFRGTLYTGESFVDVFQREYTLDDCKEVDGSEYARAKP